jgi:cullin 3
LKKIHTKDASHLSFEQLYRNAYNIVLMMRGVDLYERVKKLEQEWLDSEVQKRVNSAIPSILLPAKSQTQTELQDQANERRDTGEKFLGVLREAWEDHQISMGMITDVLMYMVGPSA